MHESDDDIRRLQELLDRTLARANPHLASIVSPERRLTARHVVGVDEIEPVWREIYGSSPFSWGEGVAFMDVEPSSMWAYAFHPENFPE